MAAPSYTTDLIDVTNAEAGTWAELTGYTGGSAVTVPDTDYYIQGAGCATQATGGKTGLSVGMAYDHGSDLGAAWTSGHCFFVWSVFLGGNSIDTLANGGIRLGVGSANGSMIMYHLVGSDYGRNPYGGWQNVVFDPANVTADSTIGTPTAGVYQWFGSLLNMVAGVSKGNLHGVDAIRYGRGEYIVTGGDLANGYATFTSMGITNDYNDATNGFNRWGLFQTVAGGFLWKGLMSLGTTTTPVDFRDSNKNITIDDTLKVQSTFNTIEINNVNSNIEWTGISFTALGSNSPGTFTMIDNATVTMKSCGFTDMGIFTFLGGTNPINVSASTFRRCNVVKPAGGSFSNCTFDQTVAPTTTGAIEFTTSGEIGACTGLTFTNYTSKYAVYIPATVTGEISFDGWKFDGTGTDVYWAGTTGTLTVNLSNGANATTFASAGGTVSFQNSVALTLTGIKDGSTVYIYDTNETLDGGNDDTLLASTPTTSLVSTGGGENSFTFAYNAGTLGGSTVNIKVFHVNYLMYRQSYILTSANASVPISQTTERNYLNP